MGESYAMKRPGKKWQDCDLKFRDMSPWGDFEGGCIGIEIETEGGAKLLIGDVNENGGVCDCCSEVSFDEKVVRMRTVFTRET